VYSITSHPDHRPELAWRCCEPGTGTASDQRAKRPLWLMEPPQRLRSEGELPVLGTTLTLLTGPERIESGWWDGRDVLRDYFVACDAAGGAFWVFRERDADKAWFLQGMFS
jgi:protein ImuB